MAARTARINTVRGVLREFGMTIPVGARRVVPRVIELLEIRLQSIPVAVNDALENAWREESRYAS